MFLSVIVIARDGNWSPTNGVVYAVFLACVCCHGLLTTFMSKIMGKLQTVFVVMNFILIAATIIALPIGAKYQRNSGHYIFAETANLTTWPTGWAFMLSWLSPIWTIGSRYSSHNSSIRSIDLTYLCRVVRLLRSHQRRSGECNESCTFWDHRINRLLLVFWPHYHDCNRSMHQP